MDDDYRKRMLAISRELRAQGVGEHMSAPPIYRLAWRLGLRIRPPLYQSFATLALGMGAFFAIVWGVVMWYLLWRDAGHPILSDAAASLAAGALFGLMTAGFYRLKARKLQLPPLSPATDDNFVL